jgi:uncharacterized RDD family membrane protein YckC
MGGDCILCPLVAVFLSQCLFIGRTVGMAIAGLRVININGRPSGDECDDDESQDLSFCQAFVRTSLLPLSTAVFSPLAFFGLIIRHDGRMLHDFIAGTGMVYSWDAEMAKSRK